MDNVQTLAIIKPDAFDRRLVGTILSRIERKGFRIVAMKATHLSRERAQQFYNMHQNKPFFDSLTGFMSSSPVVVLVLEGRRVIDDFREFIGDTDPAKSKYGTIRRDFGTSVERNVIHGSDSPEAARREIDFFFKEEDYLHRAR